MKRIILLCLAGLVVLSGYCQRGLVNSTRLNKSALAGAAFSSSFKHLNHPTYPPSSISQADRNLLIKMQQHEYTRNLRTDSLIRVSLRTVTPPKIKMKSLQEIEDEMLGRVPDSTLYSDAFRFLYSNDDTITFVKYLRVGAKKGYAPALYDYGRIHVMGQYVKKDVKQGWNMIQKAAQQGHSLAMYELGNEYYYDNYTECVPQDTIEGFEWLRKAADTGHLYANLTIASISEERGDMANAIRYYAMAEDIGWNHRSSYVDEDEQATIRDIAVFLGNCHYYGNEYYSKDIDTAIKYWSHAAYWGHPEAAYHVGRRLIEGTEVEQNIDLGIRYTKVAALLGNAEAQAYYGDCYMNGDGVERDSLKAIEWYKKAGQSGHEGAQYWLASNYYWANDNDSTIYWGEKHGCRDSSLIQYYVGMAYYMKENTEEAKKWLEKAAEQNEPDAYWRLGCLVWESDSATGFSYLQKAAELGHPEAISDMGIEYLYGGFVEKDVEKSIGLLNQAAEMGSANAFNTLGIVYYWKKYKRKNRKLAADYWRRGAELEPELIGTADCQYSYGCCLKKGHGVKKDKEAAIRWLKLAVKNGSKEAREELQKMHISIDPEPVNTAGESGRHADK